MQIVVYYTKQFSMYKIQIWLGEANPKNPWDPLKTKLLQVNAENDDEAMEKYLKKFPGMREHMTKESGWWKYGGAPIYFKYLT